MANGHGRHITVTPERTPASVVEIAVTHNHYKKMYNLFASEAATQSRSGRFTSENAVRRF